jgi:predicted amidohydrolase
MQRTLTVAIAQLHPHKGDYRANLARLRDIFAQVRMLSPHPQVLHFPETVLSGYFVEGGVRDVAVTAGTLARDLDQAYADGPKDDRARRPLDVVVGFYEKWRDTMYNSAAYVRLGDGAARILHVHRKNFLPTYGLFDEERFVERGHALRAFDTPWGRAAILVCEDAWHSITGTMAALDDAQMIFLCAAAPARGLQARDGVPGPGSVARWERLVKDMADEHGVFVSLSNLAGSEGGKVFAGGSCVAGPRGDVRVRAPAFDEAIVTLTIDLGDITRARADMPLLSGTCAERSTRWSEPNRSWRHSTPPRTTPGHGGPPPKVNMAPLPRTTIITATQASSFQRNTSRAMPTGVRLRSTSMPTWSRSG